MTNQEIIQGTLEWCNERRKEGGLEPLADLPKGVKYDGRSCPCGRACGWWVGYYSATRNLSQEKRYDLEWKGVPGYVGLPLAVKEFTKRFDDGQFPQYEEKVSL